MSDAEPPRPPLPPTQPLGASVPPRQPHPPPVVAEPAIERLPPELPPEDRWATPWAALLAGVIGLIVGALLGYLVGHHGKTVTEARSGPSPAVANTVTHTTTVVRPQVVVHTVTAKTVTQTPAPAGVEDEARRKEAESTVRKLERENEELRRQSEEGGG